MLFAQNKTKKATTRGRNKIKNYELKIKNF
jgi:hypothetical protein